MTEEVVSKKIDMAKSELAFHGIRVTEDGQCYSFMEGQDKPSQSSCQEKIALLLREVEENKIIIKVFWKKICTLLLNKPVGLVGGSQSTEKMFVASLKHLLRFSKRFKHFGKTSKIFKQALQTDSQRFNESVMSKVVDYKICIDWMNHIVQNGMFCVKLLKYFESNRQKQVVAQQMVPGGSLDLEEEERHWSWDETQEDYEDSRKDYYNQTELSGGNDPEWLSQGFNWNEYRNDPYTYGDEDDDPYPHYYNFKSKVHKGIDV